MRTINISFTKHCDTIIAMLCVFQKIMDKFTKFDSFLVLLVGAFFLFAGAAISHFTTIHNCRVSNVGFSSAASGRFYASTVGTFTDVETNKVVCAACKIQDNFLQALQKNPDALIPIESYGAEAKTYMWACFTFGAIWVLAFLIFLFNDIFLKND